MDKLINESREYSDTKLLNIIKQTHNYRSEIVEAAKVIARERGLITQQHSDSKINLVNEAKRMLEQNIPANEVLKRITANGNDEKEVENAIFQASKVADFQKEAKQKAAKTEKNSSKWWYLFIAFIVIKMIFRLASNN